MGYPKDIDDYTDRELAEELLRRHPPEQDFYAWWRRHESWSWNTFGPSDIRGPEGPIDHLRKEVEELARAPRDIEEVADVIHLAADVAWRAGYTFKDFMDTLNAKQRKNMARKWPDWRTAPANKAIEHDRSEEA